MDSINEGLAVDLGAPKQLPNMFLGEFPHVNWGFEEVIMDSGRAGIRFVFEPVLLPMFKFSIPMERAGLERLHMDILKALAEFDANYEPDKTLT